MLLLDILVEYNFSISPMGSLESFPEYLLILVSLTVFAGVSFGSHVQCFDIYVVMTLKALRSIVRLEFIQ